MSLIPSVLAAEYKIDKKLLEVSGVTQEDLNRVSGIKELTLFDAYILSIKNTEKLLISEEDVKQSIARRNQAIGSFLPSISLKALKVLPIKKNVPASVYTGASLNARQPIITGLNEIAALKAAKASLRVSDYQLYLASSTLLFDVANNFFNIKEIEKAIAIREEILTEYRKMLHELQRREAIGRSNKSDVLRTSTQIYQLEADLKTLMNDLSTARLALSSLMGTSIDYTISDALTLPEPPYLENDMHSMVERRWDVKTAREQIKLAEANLAAAWGGNLPSVYVEGTYNFYPKTSPKPFYYVGLGVELPLFSGGIVWEKVKEAESKKRQVEYQLTEVLRSAHQEILDSYKSWLSTKERLDAYNKAFLTAKENYSVVTREYNLHMLTLIDVISSLNSLLTAQENYETAQLQNKINRIRLGVAINELPGTGISALRGK